MTARYFAPKTVSTKYRDLMETFADELVAEATASDTFRLDQLSLRYSVEVAAQVIGLTDSPIRPMSRRLERFFDQPSFDATQADGGRNRFEKLRAVITGNLPMATFYLFDVRPAIRKRRRLPADDIISHLIAEGYTNADILVECLTYGTAGMVTTREFITMAAWHLLDDQDLADRYRAAQRPERLAILNEILRLEPVVGHLYRRATAPFTLTEGDRTWAVASGDLIDVAVRQANADPDAVGADALTLCPGRRLPAGVNEAGLSFGDGAHRCPGQPLAVLEADVLLTRLLAREPVVLGEPALGWDDLIAGYTLRGLRLRLEAPATTAGRQP